MALGKMDDKGGRKNCFDVDNVKIWRKAFDFFLITFFAVEKHAAAKRELPAIDQLLVRESDVCVRSAPVNLDRFKRKDGKSKGDQNGRQQNNA